MPAVTIDTSWNPDFLAAQAGLEKDWGAATSADGSTQTFIFSTAKFDDVHAAIDAYPAAWLAKRKTERRQMAEFEKDKRVLTFTFNGTPGVACDDLAINRANSVLTLLSQPETVGMTVGWEVSPGVFVDLVRESIRQLGLAMGQHVQGCWSHYRALVTQINAPDITLEALEALDLTTGWPA